MYGTIHKGIDAHQLYIGTEQGIVFHVPPPTKVASIVLTQVAKPERPASTRLV